MRGGGTIFDEVTHVDVTPIIMSEVDFLQQNTSKSLLLDRKQEIKPLGVHKEEDVVLNRSAEDQHLIEVKKEVPDLRSSSLNQQDPEVLHIKVEDELWTSQEKCVIQLHQIKTEDNRKAEPPTSSSADQINAEPDGDDYGGPEPDPEESRAYWHPEDQQLMEVKEEVPDLRSSSLDQQDPELLPIKEEEEELWISQDKEQLTVKSEDEDNPQLLQFQQIKTEDNREAEPPTSNSADQINTEPDGDDCGGPETDRNPNPNTPSQPNTDKKAPDSSETEVSEDEDDDWDENVSSSGSESEDSDEGWRQIKTLRSGVKRNARHQTIKKSFSCPKCFKQFVNKMCFQKHVTSHSGESSSSFIDLKCSRRKQNLDLHKGDKAGKRQPICDQCGKTFKSLCYHKIHMRRHTGEKPYACVDCGKTFYHQHHLKYHMFQHTGEKPFACDKCNKTFSMLSSLKCHMMRHTEPKHFQCEVCNKNISSLGNLNQHMSIHSGERQFACTNCDRRFRRDRDLQAHIMSHTGEKPFVCGDCGARFSRQGSLCKHIKIHTGERPFACDKCDKRFIQSTDLKKHLPVHLKVKKVSTQNRRFACKECGKKFVQSSHLIIHKVVHTREKPFSCDICCANFTRRDSLKRHNIKVHNNK